VPLERPRGGDHRVGAEHLGVGVARRPELLDAHPVALQQGHRRGRARRLGAERPPAGGQVARDRRLEAVVHGERERTVAARPAQSARHAGLGARGVGRAGEVLGEHRLRVGARRQPRRDRDRRPGGGGRAAPGEHRRRRLGEHREQLAHERVRRAHAPLERGRGCTPRRAPRGGPRTP
jgi:hypothetical protein